MQVKTLTAQSTYIATRLVNHYAIIGKETNKHLKLFFVAMGIFQRDNQIIAVTANRARCIRHLLDIAEHIIDECVKVGDMLVIFAVNIYTDEPAMFYEVFR